MITTNTGAKKLEASDNWREIFPNPGTGTAGAHNATVDAQDRIQAEVAPIINGKQCALGAASGDYVLLRNSTITGKSDGAYIATKAIPANTDIDSTYLGNAITGGISNSLNSNITSLSDQIGIQGKSKVSSVASLEALKTHILACKSQASWNKDGVIHFGFNNTFTDSTFTTQTYYRGTLYKVDGTNYFVALISSLIGSVIQITYNNGTWGFNSIR